MTYNQKEHERWKAKSKEIPAVILVLKDFEHKKDAFLKGYDGWI